MDARAREGGRPLPAVRDDELRRHLPARARPPLTDWGRSERIEGLMDRTLYDFFYRYWFRAEVEGIENVPAAGARCSCRTTPARCHPTPR